MPQTHQLSPSKLKWKPNRNGNEYNSLLSQLKGTQIKQAQETRQSKPEILVKSHNTQARTKPHLWESLREVGKEGKTSAKKREDKGRKTPKCAMEKNSGKCNWISWFLWRFGFFFLNGWKEVEPRFVFEMQP